MRLGIFGGSFNPIHIAHLRCAEEARESLRLDRVLFIPSASPPHKKIRDLAPARHRLAMVRRAVARHPAFSVSAVEIDRPGRSYSVDTLRILRERAPAGTGFVFLLGTDAFREIETWKEYRTLFGLADFAVISRPPHLHTSLRTLLPVAARREFCYKKDGTLVHDSGNRIFHLSVTAFDISASAIRQRLGAGRSIRYLVPPAVEAYILQNGLYARRGKAS